MAKIHKHIARRTKKYVSHITKYLYERDTIFATIACFAFLILLGLIPINFYVLNPMKLALKDFDFNDITYAKLGKGTENPLDNRIVILNIGKCNREEIAHMIEKVATYQPKVIGLDVLFNDSKDEHQDSVLRNTFLKTKNLVSVSRLIPEEKDFSIHKNYFDDAIALRGAANLIGEDIGTIRLYSPFEKVGDTAFPHITSALVRVYDSAAYQNLVKRKKPVEIINYTRKTDQYMVLEWDDLLFDNVDSGLIKNKIVLLGYVNPNPDDIEDKKFTPMNQKFAGKSIPDMNGVIVQANIISMVLDANFIKKTPKWVAWLVAIIIGWIHMSLFVRYYLEDHIWFHLVAKLAQVFSAIFFAYLGMYIFDKFVIKLDMKYTLYVIALAVDIIYFYEAFAVWLNKKTGFKTVFQHHHHGGGH